MSVAAFDVATAARAAGDGSWEVTVDPGWGAPVGPNGGYIAALVLRAMTAELARPERTPRSLTCHYLRAPAAGPARVDVVVERSGRSLSTLTARLEQDGRPCVIAVAAFSTDRPGAAEYADPPPDVTPPDQLRAIGPAVGGPGLFDHLELRPAIGGRPFQGGDEALTGGWLRLADVRPVDALSLALFCDAWWPAPWMRLRELSPSPTVDLTFHFRATPRLPADAHVLVRVRSSVAHAGFFDEDAQVWSPDGTLLAQSRQLALIVPAKP